MGMDNLVRDGHKQTWIGTNRAGVTDRKITAIAGNKLTIDIGLADSYDAKYLGSTATIIANVKPSAAVDCVGIEHLHFQCPPLEIDYGHAPIRRSVSVGMIAGFATCTAKS